MPLSLTEWESFYVITGSSGAALTGLMFVVVALAADRLGRAPADGLGAFSTPTVAHFSIVLLVASLMSMPLHHVAGLRACLGACALVGLFFSVRAAFRMVRLSSYEAVIEDWLFNVIAPFAGYLALLIAALLLERSPQKALVAVAIVVLALLFLGIRNAWDVAIFLVTAQHLGAPTQSPGDAAPRGD